MNNLSKRQFSILTDIGNTELYDFDAPNWQDARDTFIGSAFEHQLGLSKKFKPDVIVRSKMMANRKYEIAFTADHNEVERWKLREKGNGIGVRVRNLIAGWFNV
jgi:hypothetical protein